MRCVIDRKRSVIEIAFFGMVALLAVAALTLAQPWATWSVVLAGAGSSAALWYGVHRFRPPGPGAWVTLGVALTLMALGDVLRWLRPATDVDVVLTSVGYAVAVAAAATVLWQRGALANRDGLPDIAILSVAGAAVLWELSVVPQLAVAVGEPAQLSAVLYPLFDVLLFGLVARLALSGTTSRSLHYLLAALSVALLGDVAATVLDVDLLHPLVLACDLAARSLAAASALTPSMRSLADPQEHGGDANPSPRRLLLIMVGCLVLSGVLGGQQALTNGLDGLGALVGPPVIAVLLLARLNQVLIQHDRIRGQLAHAAAHDPLTGLANRRRLLEHITAALTRPEAEGRLAVLFCDLDRFKRVNDVFGHGAGDELLRMVAARLRTVLRSDDLLGRLGGTSSPSARCPSTAPTRPWRSANGSATFSLPPLPSRVANWPSAPASGLRLPTRAPTPSGCCATPTSPCTRANDGGTDAWCASNPTWSSA